MIFLKYFKNTTIISIKIKFSPKNTLVYHSLVMSDRFDEEDLYNLAQFWSDMLTRMHEEGLFNQVVVIRAYIGGASCVQTAPFEEAIRSFLAESKVAKDDRR
jgi:hypothetical protein